MPIASKTLASITQQVKKQQIRFLSLAKSILTTLILPCKPIFSKIKDIFMNNKIQPGESSKLFNRRRFEQHLQTLKLTQDDLGFTNQILYQQSKKKINFYVPVYITNKIKSIQDISVQTLIGNVSCAMIINVYYEGLPQEIINALESSITIQLNKGEAIKLVKDGILINFKRQKDSKLLIFTIRKVFSAFLHEDTLWSPFQLIQLIISVTLNTVSIAPHSLAKISQTSEYCPDKQYKISFNCMRIIDPIPISYALDCAFGVYDLAQKRLQAYHTKYGTLGQIQKAYEDYIAREKKKTQKKSLDSVQKAKNKQDQQVLTHSPNIKLYPKTIKQIKKQTPPKLDYFQYTHFIVPLYKYPGNSLATIFIPIFLLALVSLAIFFQQPQLSGRIGAIATMILGYIALIPSIKEQLPPSSKLTIIQSVVYIQTMCCLLCLYESFSIEGEEYSFVWHENYTFLLCLFTHISTFFFIVGLYAVHKLKWQPSYNCDEKVKQNKPAGRLPLWDNPYCDEVFIKFNEAIKNGNYSKEQKEQLLVRPLKDKHLSKPLEKKTSQSIKLEHDKSVKEASEIKKKKK